MAPMDKVQITAGPAAAVEDGAQTLRLMVNGDALSVQASPQASLLEVLRNGLGLKAAKFGCGLGQCGACTVLVDGRPVTACDTPAEFAEGRRVETVEGLAGEGGPHPLQRAFLDGQAVQCGYCAAGVLMSAKALLEANPSPSRADICSALERHLCRCGAHPRILRAIEHAGRLLRELSP